MCPHTLSVYISIFCFISLAWYWRCLALSSVQETSARNCEATKSVEPSWGACGSPEEIQTGKFNFICIQVEKLQFIWGPSKNYTEIFASNSLLLFCWEVESFPSFLRNILNNLLVNVLLQFIQNTKRQIFSSVLFISEKHLNVFTPRVTWKEFCSTKALNF